MRFVMHGRIKMLYHCTSRIYMYANHMQESNRLMVHVALPIIVGVWPMAVLLWQHDECIIARKIIIYSHRVKSGTCRYIHVYTYTVDRNTTMYYVHVYTLFRFRARDL